MRAESNEASYSEWNQRIYKRLGLQWGAKDAFGALPPGAWLMVPKDNQEFTEIEETDLFAAVRTYVNVRPSSLGIRALARWTETVSPLNALPLLFAARSIARRFGSRGRYWPAFAAHLLCIPEGDEALDTVRMILAPSLTALWRRFRYDSRDRVYVPRTGRANIKWPLAHAGLLTSEQQCLRAFGAVLHQWFEGDAENALLTIENLPDFQDELRLWLDNQLYWQQANTLRERLRDTESADIVSELAQLLLVREWGTFSQTAQIQATAKRDQWPKVRLRFDSVDRRLYFGVSPCVFQGDIAEVILTVSNNGVKEIVRPGLIRSGGRTIGYPIPRAFPGPARPDKRFLGAIEIRRRNDERETRRFETFADDAARPAFLFRAEDGFAVRSLTPGEAYLLLAPQPQWSRDEAKVARTVLFAGGGSDCGTPINASEWEYYAIFAVTAKAPPAVSLDERADFAAAWRNAEEYFSLLPVDHLWKPRAKLIGRRLSHSADLPEYACAAPPHAEIQGDIMGGLLTLERKDHRGETFVVDTLTVTGAAETDVLDLFAGLRPQAGEYALRFKKQNLSRFRLTERSAVVAPTPPPMRLTLDITAEKAGWGFAGGASVKRGIEELKNARLTITGWPGGVAHLNIWRGESALAGQAAPVASLPIEFDTMGTASVRWDDLGLKNWCEGEISLRAVWKGLLASPKRIFAERAFVTNCRPKNLFSGAYSVQGGIFRPEGVTERRIETVVVTLIGDAPWEGEIASYPRPINADGAFSVPFAPAGFAVLWISVTSSEGILTPYVESVSANDTETSPLVSLWEMSGGKTGRKWSALAKQLRGTALPAALLRLIPPCDEETIRDWDTILDRWTAVLFYKAAWRRWMPLERTSQFTALKRWEKNPPDGSPWRLALFLNQTPERRPAGGYGYESPDKMALWREGLMSAPLTDIKLGRFVEMQTCGTESAALRCQLRLKEAGDDTLALVLQTGDQTISCCRVCGQIGAPASGSSQDSFAHTCACGGEICPGRIRARFEPDKQYSSVRLCLLWSPLTLFDAICNVVKQLGSNEPPPGSESYLERLWAVCQTALDNGDWANETTWRTALLSCLRRLRTQAVSGEYKPSEMSALMQKYDSFRAALFIVAEWLDNDLKEIEGK